MERSRNDTKSLNDKTHIVTCCLGDDAEGDELLADLQKYVDEDNERFEAELMAWDCEHRKKTSRGSTGCNDDVSAAGNYHMMFCRLTRCLH